MSIDKHIGKSIRALAGGFVVAGLTAAASSGAWAQATNLVCTGCVQSSDLANGAVTSAKIAGGAVTNGKIADNAVNADKIATGAITAPKIGPNAVNTSKIVTGAITSAKIGAGAVNVNKLANSAVSTAKLQAGAVTSSRLADGAVSAAKFGIANTVHIDDQGNPSANCTELRNVLAGLTGPAAVVLGPGTYDCGSNHVLLTSGISLIGAGRNLVTITGTQTSLDGLVRLQGNNIKLQGLTVFSDVSGLGFATAVTIGADHVTTLDWRLEEITAEAANGTNFTFGVYAREVDCDGGKMSDVIARASGGDTNNRGIEFECLSGSITATDVRSEATGSIPRGLVKFGLSTLTVRNSSFSGGDRSVSLSVGNLRVISSELDGSLFGAVDCVGNYTGSGAALSNGTNGSGGCLLPP